MSNFSWTSVGFLVGIAVAFSWSKLLESQLVKEAISAEKDGRAINNEFMQAMYPQAYRIGNPQYLERDFEAGADFICDAIQDKYGEDLCSKDGIRWR